MMLVASSNVPRGALVDTRDLSSLAPEAALWAQPVQAGAPYGAAYLPRHIVFLSSLCLCGQRLILANEQYLLGRRCREGGRVGEQVLDRET